ncbi:MAG: hypothetical protein JJU00_17535 [Opitutales bacterium]|nr:hypothetical protein [Opitutales bacterium]
MNTPFTRPDEPLRLALVLMLLALLLPLCVVVWLLLKNVNTERMAVRQELTDAYRAQFTSLVAEKTEDWQDYVAAFPWEESAGAGAREWMRDGGLEAMLVVDAAGSLRYPAPGAGTAAPLLPPDETLSALLAGLSAARAEDGPVPPMLEEAIVNHLAGLNAQWPARAGDRSVRRALLRLSELTAAGDPWAAPLAALWLDFHDTAAADPLHGDWRERGFIAHRLRALPPVADAAGDLREALREATRRFRLQEQLLRFYYQQNWTTGEPMERWLVFLKPDEELAGEPVFTHIKTDPAGVVILQIRESVFTDRLASVWEGPAAAGNLWIRVRAPSGITRANLPAAGITTEPFTTVDLAAPFYGWRLDLGFRDEGFLTRTTRRATTFSAVAGATLVILIAAIGFLAVRQVNRQIQLNRLKNDFIGLVSHELRTPLASMRMLVDTLLEGRYRDETTLREYLALVSGENRRLSRLVENFLTFSRMQRGRSQFRRHTAAVDGILSAALAATKPHMEAPGVAFRTDIEPRLPDVTGDEDALATVLINLLENAWKYTGDDKRIALRAYGGGGEVVFEVTDNGIGISPREQRQIFREFYQVDNRLARRSEGSGLGLAINRHIVRAHGGRIEVESRPGEGSTFRVRLPVRHAPAPEAVT